MKPYGLRAGDGERGARGTGKNKFIRQMDEGGPKGAHKESKIHDEKRLCHRQARADERKMLHDAKNGRGDD